MPKVSIVVPVYNVPFDFLDQCIDSILNQTYKNIEIIIVDDGSPQEWAEKCDSYKKIDNRIIVLHKINGGLSDARNYGMSKATGEWITFIDGDDWVDKDFIDYAINRIKNQSSDERSDIYYFSGYRNYPSKEIEGKPYFPDGTKFKSYDQRENLQSLCLTNHVAKEGNPKGITVSSGCMKLYNINFLRTNNLLFPLVPYDEDSLFFLDSIENSKSIEYCSKPVYHYRFNDDSITTKYRPDADKEQEVYLNYIFNFAEKHNKNKCFRDKIWMRVMTQMLVILNLKFFHEQNKDSYLKKHINAWKCFRQEPFKSAIKNLKSKDMRRNPKIKFFLLKLGLYGLIVSGKKHNSKHLRKN